MSKEPKRLVIENRAFSLNGTKVFVNERLSVARFQVLEDLKMRIQFGSELSIFPKRVGEAFEDLNKFRFGDAAVKLGKLKDALDEQMKQAGHPFLLIATLFMTKEGGDSGNWNEGEAVQLLNDIAKDGYDVEDVFFLARAKFDSFTSRLNGDMPDSSNLSHEQEQI